MSKSQYPLQLARTIDPVINVNNERSYAVFEGGSTVNYFPLTSSSFSNSSAQLSTTTPSPQTVMDRNLKMKLPVTIDFVGTTVNPASNLLQTGYDAIRAFPISNITNTLTVTINNSSMSINMSDLIDPLMRYNQCHSAQEYFYSTSPSMQDQYQEYADGAGAVNNPLAGYQDNSYETPRGAFPYTITNHTNTTATVNTVLTENLFLSPFIWGKIQQSGLLGVQEISFNFTFVPNLSRLWCHSNAGGSTLTSVNVTIGQPTMLFKYVSMKSTQKIPKIIQYPFYNVDRYPTDAGVAIAPGASITLPGANIQLRSIPKQIYVFARERNADRSFTTTDTYFGIENINLNWDNNSGLLASASKQDLYDISVRNGCTLSWPQWSGDTTRTIGATQTTIGTVGSVLNLAFGKDIGLTATQAPGQLGTFQMQMNVTVTNKNRTRAIIPTLYVVVVSEGTLIIAENRAIQEIGIVTKDDVLNAAGRPVIPYEDIDTVYGGNFLDSIKRFGSTLWKGLKKYGPPALKAATTLAPLLALGEDGEYYPMDQQEMRQLAAGKRGGVLLGGRKLTRRYMMKRLTSV